MSERMPPASSPEGRRPVPTNMTMDQYKAHRLAEKAAAEAAQRAQQQASRPQQRPQPYPQPRAPQYQQPQRPFSQTQAPYPRFPTHTADAYVPELPVDTPDVAKKHRKFSERARKNTLKIGAGVALAAVLGGGYAGNLLGVRDWQPFGAESGITDNGIDQIALEEAGTEIFSPEQCMLPESVVMVVTVEGYMPLVPMLKTKDSKSAELVPGYVTKANQATVPAEKQEQFGNFITEDGYLRATLENIPLSLTICEKPGANATAEVSDGITVTRSALDVTFKDPDGLFNDNIISVVPQVEDDDVAVNQEKGEYMTFPNPAGPGAAGKANPPENMFLGPNGDEVHDKSLDRLKNAMVTEADRRSQLTAMLKLMESKVITQLKTRRESTDDVAFPGDAPTLQQAIDNALRKRLGGDSGKTVFFTGNYKPTMEVPRSETTKEYITEIDPKTGESALKGFDSSQEFYIENIEITYGGVKAPDPQEQDEPEEPVTPTTPTPETNESAAKKD